MIHKTAYLPRIFATREASAAIAIHWNVVTNGHFPFLITDTSTSTHADVIVSCFWAKYESLLWLIIYNTIKTNPWTWSGAPHLANGLCPFGITANLIWRPRHCAVWRDPGTNTWLLFRQNALQNVFNWVLCSHFIQFQTGQKWLI